MKPYTIGIVAATILLVGTGVGSGIARAEGMHSERPVLGFQEIGALDTLDASSAYAESRPVLSFEEEGLPQVAKTPEGNMQMEGPVEAGSLPSGNDEDPSLFEGGGTPYREGQDAGP